MALTGWAFSGKLKENQVAIECVACFRRIAFVTNEQRGSEVNTFDPVRSHLKHCYFAPSQSENKDPAWRVLMTMMNKGRKSIS